MEKMTFGQRLRCARKHAELTQEKLAEASNVPQQVISRIERGGQETSAHLVQLAMACKVDPRWLATGDGSMVSSASDPAVASFLDDLSALPESWRNHVMQHVRQMRDAATGLDSFTRARTVTAAIASPDQLRRPHMIEDVEIGSPWRVASVRAAHPRRRAS